MEYLEQLDKTIDALRTEHRELLDKAFNFKNGLSDEKLTDEEEHLYSLVHASISNLLLLAS